MFTKTTSITLIFVIAFSFVYVLFINEASITGQQVIGAGDKKHFECVSQTCTLVSGKGANKCSSDSDCKVNAKWLVFVTEGKTKGKIMNQTLGGSFASADYFCNVEAHVFNHPGAYVAWLSNKSLNAKDRIKDGIYYNAEDKIVAMNKVDLLDGTLLNPIDNTNKTKGVWTGTGYDGNSYGNKTNADCYGWNFQRTVVKGVVGKSDKTNKVWTQYAQPEACSNLNHLYCFQIA